MSIIKSIGGKLTVQALNATILTVTLSYLAATKAVSPDIFVGAVVGGAFVWLFGRAGSAT